MEEDVENEDENQNKNEFENVNDSENIFAQNQLSSHFLMGKKDNDNELSITSEYNIHNTQNKKNNTNTNSHRNSQNFISPIYGNQNNGFQNHENTAIVTPSINSENRNNENSNNNNIFNFEEHENINENENDYQIQINEDRNRRFLNWERIENELKKEIIRLSGRGKQMSNDNLHYLTHFFFTSLQKNYHSSLA